MSAKSSQSVHGEDREMLKKSNTKSKAINKKQAKYLWKVQKIKKINVKEVKIWESSKFATGKLHTKQKCANVLWNKRGSRKGENSMLVTNIENFLKIKLKRAKLNI